MTAPLSAAYLMARTVASELLTVLPENIWQLMIFTPGMSAFPPAIGLMPMPLLFCAAITPATCVPWPVSLTSSHEMTPVSKTKL